MRILSFLTLCLSALQLTLAAETGTPPACGLKCIAVSAVNSDCHSIANITCICTNQLLLAQITECVTASCSIRDQLATKKFSSDTCGVEGEDRRQLIRIIAVVFGALGILAFGLRCISKLMMGLQSWGHDDTVMCLTMCFMIPLECISFPITQHGLGLDIWNVSPDDITELLHLYFFDEIVYITALALTKISILFFYLKVFPKRSFRICAWTLIGLNLAYAIAYDFLLIFQCDPIPGAWKFWDGEFEAKCISINVLGWSAAAINIVLDLAVIILPLPELFRLSMSLRKRLQIVAMFAVGFFITIVSIIRLSSLLRFGTTSNLTQDYVEVGYWSTIEVPVGVICACMPAARSLFSVALPKVFGTSKDATKTFETYGPSSKLAGSNKISVKQEWTVLRDSSDEPSPRARSDSDVELMMVKGAGSNGKQNSTTTFVEVHSKGNEWSGGHVSSGGKNKNGGSGEF